MKNKELDQRLQLAVNMGVSGTDILHGELKNLMYETEQRLDNADGADPVYPYLQGMLDAYVDIYALTYQLSFAISDRIKARG
jgi:hypothetical protein